MATFTAEELAFLRGERRLARLATVDDDGLPHVVPVGWSLNDELGTIDVGGRQFASTKKFRNVEATGKAAIVIDDVLPPWRPRCVMVQGSAEAITGDEPLIRIHPARIVSWGVTER